MIYRGADGEPDGTVSIYLDGLSRRLHGNPATAEKDREIRSWLRNHGYEVIEIAVNRLNDEDAMVRHFRRLAGHLGRQDLRGKVKTDRSWFRTPSCLNSAQRWVGAPCPAASESSAGSARNFRPSAPTTLRTVSSVGSRSPESAL